MKDLKVRVKKDSNIFYMTMINVVPIARGFGEIETIAICYDEVGDIFTFDIESVQVIVDAE